MDKVIRWPVWGCLKWCCLINVFKCIYISYIYMIYMYFLYIHICMFCLYSVLISCTNTGGWIVSTRLGITTACPHVLVVNTSHPGASYSSLVAERCAGILVCFILYSCYCKLIDLLATIIDTKLTCVFIVIWQAYQAVVESPSNLFKLLKGRPVYHYEYIGSVKKNDPRLGAPVSMLRLWNG